MIEENMPVDISVIVVQYNPDLEKIKRTLKTVVVQKDCVFEIVIADDGSKEDYFTEIEEIFLQYNYKNYKFIKNAKNQGTVKNVISGLEIACGKYVRVIAPGDGIYCDETLSHIVKFMTSNKAKESFGKLAGYKKTEDGMELVDFSAPINVDCYQDSCAEREVIKNLLVYGDNISGAAYSWDRKYYLACLRKIENKVVYLEDCVNVYTVLEKNKIYYMDEYVTWYEHGTGVSTSGNKRWLKLLSNDWKNFFILLKNEYPRDNLIERGMLLRRLASRNDLISKVVLNILFIDRWFYFNKIKKKNEFKEKPDIMLLEGGKNASN